MMKKKEQFIFSKAINGLSVDGLTGLFMPHQIYVITLPGGGELRYRTPYELGYLVGSSEIGFPNPYEPDEPDFQSFNNGLLFSKNKHMPIPADSTAYQLGYLMALGDIDSPNPYKPNEPDFYYFKEGFSNARQIT